MKFSICSVVVVVFVGLTILTGDFAQKTSDTSNRTDELSGGTTVASETEPVDSGKDTDHARKRGSIRSILRAGGIVGGMIILLAFAAVAFVIEHLLTIRRSTINPPELADRLSHLVQSGDRAKAIALCQANPGFLSHVVLPALMQPWNRWDYVEKAAKDALATQAGKLFRKIDLFSLAGKMALMLGLLGTVIGMIVTFRALSISGGMAGDADLVEGISLALVTTAEGLIVAIPFLAIHALLTNRLVNLAGDVAFTVEQILGPIKCTAAKPE